MACNLSETVGRRSSPRSSIHLIYIAPRYTWPIPFGGDAGKSAKTPVANVPNRKERGGTQFQRRMGRERGGDPRAALENATDNTGATNSTPARPLLTPCGFRRILGPSSGVPCSTGPE